MTHDPNLEKLDEVSGEIRKASAGLEGAKPAQESSEPDSGNNALAAVGYNFLGSILGGAFIGWGVDKFFHTQPWGVLGFIALGFSAGIYNVWRALK